jgi:DNA-binding NarL/FixJ family response regulator
MKILIVEDHPLVQEVLRSLAGEVFKEASIDVVGSFAEAVEKARAAEPPDLVLLDLGLPDCAGMETLKRFRRVHAALRVVVLSETEDHASAFAALQAGACGFVSKTYTRPVISAALRLAAAGGLSMPPLPIGARRTAARRPESDLTRRQVDVLRLIARGMRNKEIALRLKIAEDTVKQHARAAYGVLGVSSRMQVVGAVARRGLRFD